MIYLGAGRISRTSVCAAGLVLGLAGCSLHDYPSGGSPADGSVGSAGGRLTVFMRPYTDKPPPRQRIPPDGLAAFDRPHGGGQPEGGAPAAGGPAASAGVTGTPGVTGGAGAGGSDGHPPHSGTPSEPAAGAMGADPPDMDPGREAPAARDFEAPGTAVAIDDRVGHGFEVPERSRRRRHPPCKTTYPDPEWTDKPLSLYRPDRLAQGKRYPLVLWSSSRCVHGSDERTLLAWIASHGIMVVAGNSRDAPADKVLDKALDWVVAAQTDRENPYYKRFDLERIGALGVADSSEAAATFAEHDGWIKTVALLDGARSSPHPFLTISGDRHSGKRHSRFRKAVKRAAREPAAFLWLGDVRRDKVVMHKPERVAPFIAAWFRYRLLDDGAARDWLKQAECRVCGRYALHERGL